MADEPVTNASGPPEPESDAPSNHGEGSELGELLQEVRFLKQRLALALKGEHVACRLGPFVHDLNNVLGGIMGFAELAQEEIDPNGPGQQELIEILDAGLRGRNLVNELISLRRRISPEPVPVDLQELLVAELRRWGSTQVDAGKHDFRPHPDLPRIKGDREELALLLAGLIRLFGALPLAGVTIWRVGHCEGLVPGHRDSTSRQWVTLEVIAPNASFPEDWLARILLHDRVPPAPADREPEISGLIVTLLRNHGHLVCGAPESGDAVLTLYFPAVQD